MPPEQPIDVRDMAIVHKTFRRTFTESGELVRAQPSPSPERVTFLADHIDFGIGLLHHHHAVEDELLYPLLAERVPEQAEMIKTVEAQHSTVTGTIEAATAACQAWRASPNPDTAGVLADSLDHLNEVLQPHLDDEENKVVPLAARHLTQTEWDAVGERATEDIPRAKMPIAFGLVMEPLGAPEQALMKAHLPAPVRLLYPLLIDRPWRKYAKTLRHGT